MRIALFAEQDPVTPCGAATTTAALIGHLPRDMQIIEYRPGPDRLSGLRADQILQRAKRGSLSSDFASTPMRRKYLGVLPEKCARVFASSSAERERLTAAGVEPSKIAIVGPGVDTDLFAPSKRSASLRERWQVSDSRPAVIYVGTLTETKSSRRLLSLEMGLLRSNPMHRLIGVGDGSGRAELEHTCSHAVFMGSRPHHEIPEVLASADLFVCPSEMCSTNHAVLEAQASGLPPLVMERGSAVERISEHSGCVCRIDSRPDGGNSGAGQKRCPAERNGQGRSRVRSSTGIGRRGRSAVCGVPRCSRRLRRWSGAPPSPRFAGPTPLIRTAPWSLRRGASRESCSFVSIDRVARARPSRTRRVRS